MTSGMTQAEGSTPMRTPRREFVNLPYAKGTRNVLDVFVPERAVNPPLVLFIHGGSWFRGDKSQVLVNDRLNQLLAEGFAVAAMNHTYSQDAIWPQQRNDVVAAITFLQDRASDFGYDFSRLSVWGQSSGGHLALWAGILSAQSLLPDIKSIVCWFPPSNLYELWHDRDKDSVPRGNENEILPTPETRLIGCDAQANKELAGAVSPDVVAGQLDPALELAPIMLVHGTSDPAVSPLQSDRLYQTLAARGSRVERLAIEGGGHGGAEFDEAVPSSIQFLSMHI